MQADRKSGQSIQRNCRRRRKERKKGEETERNAADADAHSSVREGKKGGQDWNEGKRIPRALFFLQRFKVEAHQIRVSLQFQFSVRFLFERWRQEDGSLEEGRKRRNN